MPVTPDLSGLTVRDAVSHEDIAAARRLHGRCYLGAGYVEELSPEGTIDDPWVPHSVYKVAIDEASGELVGTCRMIQPSVRGFPLFTYFDVSAKADSVFSEMDPNRCTEVSALATTRSGLQDVAVGAALYAAVWQTAISDGFAYLLAEIDQRLFRLLYRQFGFPYEPLGPPRYHMGSTTIPTALYLPKAIADFRASAPEVLALYSGGLTFEELGHVEIDLRSSVAEYRPDPTVLDLAFSRPGQAATRAG